MAWSGQGDQQILYYPVNYSYPNVCAIPTHLKISRSSLVFATMGGFPRLEILEEIISFGLLYKK